jgi:predicted N-acetyltransferase YhbS
MRISFRQADWEALARLWSDFYPEALKVDADLLRQNTVECPVFDWGASSIEVMDEETLGFVAVKKSANPSLWPGGNQDMYHLSAIAYKEPEVGVDMMAQAKQTVLDRGGQRLVFGQDPHHFFPGCPDDCQSLCSFLMVEGFEKTGGHFDLERDLGDYEMPTEATPGVDFRDLVDGDLPALRAFFDREFPGRWRHDVLEKIEVEGAEKTCFGAFEGGNLLGFALIQDWRHKRPMGGGVWHLALGDKWGALGPIGVAASERGRGVGHGLLGSALMNLKNRGVRGCIIDWTTLEDFYGRHGFKVTRRYKTASLKLD